MIINAENDDYDDDSGVYVCVCIFCLSLEMKKRTTGRRREKCLEKEDMPAGVVGVFINVFG